MCGWGGGQGLLPKQPRLCLGSSWHLGRHRAGSLFWACFCLSVRNSESLSVTGGGEQGEGERGPGSWCGSCLCLFQVCSGAGEEQVLP